MAIIKLRKRKKKLKISTSLTEIKHILVSWIAISFIFTILWGNGSTESYAIMFVISAFTVGIGFLLHEAAHKFVAQKYGCFAEFRADFSMLIVAVLMAVFLRFVLIAPGAVWIHGHVTRESNGKISAAGPITNFVLAAIFLIIGVAFPYGIIPFAAGIGAMINAWLGLFNMIPFSVFDGRKIFAWNPGIWIGMVATGFSLLFLRGFLL